MRASWMTGQYGLMVHWLAPGPLPEQGPYLDDLNAAVDRFDVTRFLAEFDRSGAAWLIFTIGQNTGFYASPSAVLDELAGPGHASCRDLTLELAQGVHALGKRFIAYLPCEVAGNPSLQHGFGWNTQDGTDQSEFQQRYLRLVCEWAERYGRLLDGWWFDGCYTWPVFHHRHMRWNDWFAAARAGNPDAALTFNDGSFCVGKLQPIIPEHDYLSGETEILSEGQIRLGRSSEVKRHLPISRFVPGTQCQWHCLLPIDAFWAHGAPTTVDWISADAKARYQTGAPSTPSEMEHPLYSNPELSGFLRQCLGVGGAVTLNVGIYQEGHLGSETLEQLESLGSLL